MMSNLFAMRAVPSSTDMKQWQKEYLQGTGCEMYTETLSSSFIGMTFSQAAETCFVKVKTKESQEKDTNVDTRPVQLRLLVMAIETVNDSGKPEIAIAPLGVKIQNGTVGSCSLILI